MECICKLPTLRLARLQLFYLGTQHRLPILARVQVSRGYGTFNVTPTGSSPWCAGALPIGQDYLSAVVGDIALLNPGCGSNPGNVMVDLCGISSGTFVTTSSCSGCPVGTVVTVVMSYGVTVCPSNIGPTPLLNCTIEIF